MAVIPGTYIGTYGGAREIFRFETNGVYVQTLYLYDEAKYTNRGFWAVEKRPGRFDPTSRIALRPFLCGFDSRSGKLLLPALKYEPYYADWDEGKQQIEFDVSAGYYLKKAESEQ